MENPFEIVIEKIDRIERILLEVLGGKPNGYETLNVLNVDQAAKLLSMTKSTVYKMTSRMEIPYYKRAKRIYFKKSELEEWLLKIRKKTHEEIELEASTYVMTRKRRF